LEKINFGGKVLQDYKSVSSRIGAMRFFGESILNGLVGGSVMARKEMYKFRELAMVFKIQDTAALLHKVCDQQLANLPDAFMRLSGRYEKIQNNGWIRSVFHTGVMAVWQATHDKKYLEAAMKWAEANCWLPGPRTRLADDHCAGQIYTELYLVYKDNKMIRPIRETFDRMIADPRKGREEWWWCDALFMAPPVLARLSTATGDLRYLNFMNSLWWDTHEFLYDKECHLFFRDKHFIVKADGSGPREKKGQKIFWSRGNAWVMAGIVRVLQFMPKNYPDRKMFIQLLKEMSEAISHLQQTDGLWRASLLDADNFPAPETSGTALFCYAIAWGINNGILPRKIYMPVVENAWRGLVGCIDKNGKLGWVQLPADGARAVKETDSMEYGSGAFLLAGSEIVKFQ
jgi:unsaturated rhamnogalacturonyl hydrolase